MVDLLLFVRAEQHAHDIVGWSLRWVVFDAGLTG